MKLRTRLSRLSLRARLLIGTLVVSAFGLLIAAAAAASLLGTYLTARIDEQLSVVHNALSQLEERNDPFNPPGNSERVEGIPHEYVIEYRRPDGSLSRRFAAEERPRTLPDLPSLDLESARARGDQPFDVKALGGERHQGYRVRVRVMRGDEGVAVVAFDTTSRAETQGSLALIELGVAVVVLIVLTVLGIAAVRVGLRPLEDVERTAESIIAGGDLSRRVPVRSAPGTEIGRLAMTLNTMLTQIDGAFQQRAESESRLRRFVADASHELRTPLAGIRGLAELHRQGAVSPDEVTHLLGRVEAESRRMSVLVDDLLLLARLDEERPADRQPVDLIPVAAEAIESVRALDPDRPVSLVILPEEESTEDIPPPLVLGDEQRLHQVAANLLGNAFAHTPPGTPITVRAGVAPDGAHGLLEVIDHGPGLTPDQVEHAFERFYRGDPSRTRSTGGSGLGLSIVAAIVDAHDGSVEHVPTPGGGATFRVLLPLA
ncbi:sensor histidine kinase [Allokutzneria albata]|uniref:histidine kinase n=1 Tax=Allokutzneria albata TaxID=211114 RepID=A0A1G9TFB8_ALLAB|nr:HAMP domain-containing sensor histidine kinase [Allokutzneria albata]SDM46441.1 two-component system, OmpR family, sensor kinase [Allokutzneria albata]